MKVSLVGYGMMGSSLHNAIEKLDYSTEIFVKPEEVQPLGYCLTCSIKNSIFSSKGHRGQMRFRLGSLSDKFYLKLVS